MCNLKAMNQPCRMKFVWSFKINEGKIWVKVLKAKYGKNGLQLNIMETKVTYSSIWKSITKVCTILADAKMRQVRDGRNISVWYDKWVDISIYLKDYISQASNHLIGIKVNDLTDVNGQWNKSLLLNLFQIDMIYKIQVILPASLKEGSNVKVWLGEGIGDFSMASTYRMLTTSSLPIDDGDWSRIWKLMVP